MNPIPDELYSRFTRRARPLSARYTTVTHVRRRTQRDLRLRVCPSRGGCPVSAQAVEPEAETRRRHAAQLPAGVAALVTLGRAPRGRSSGTTLEYPEADALTWGKGSSDWTRTSNPSVNSRMLCQLSYRGPSSPDWTRTSNLPVNSRLLCQLSYRGWPAYTERTHSRLSGRRTPAARH
jgi:hypothetical protein